MGDAPPIDLASLFQGITRQNLIKLIADALKVFSGDVPRTVHIARFVSARLRQTSECGVVEGD